MRTLKRSLLALPFLLLAFGIAAGCHSTVPSLLLTIEDPTGLAPTQVRITVSVEELETHRVTRPEVPQEPLASPQTLRLFMPDEAVGRRVDLTVEALRDGVVVGTAVTVTVLKAVEDTLLAVALVPSAESDVCDATTCPFGCCDGNVCIEGDVEACGSGGGACKACDNTSSDACIEGACRCGADAPCPAGYRCEGGACAPSGEGQSCTVHEQCNAPPGQCFEAQGTCGEDGKCAYAFKASTEPCNDNNSCTEGDRCDGAGTCVAGPAKVCINTTSACLEDVGECVNGTCRYDTLPASTKCNDDNACTDNDRCDGNGACQGTPKTCTTNDPCKVSSCVNGNCVLSNKPDDTACGAVDACSHEVCQSGSCVTKAKNVGQTCSGGDACREGTTCQSNGTCGGGSPKTCPAPPNNQCWNAPTCNASTGNCTNNRKPTGTSCDDGNACTLNTTCNSSGNCTGGTPKCTTSNPCQYVAGCNSTTGACDIRDRPEGYSCGADSACSERVCDGAGACVSRPINEGGHCGSGMDCQRCMGGTCGSMCGPTMQCCHGQTCRPQGQDCGIIP